MVGDKEAAEAISGRVGCVDLDPNWPGPGGEPRGPVLCVTYPHCSCGRFDLMRCCAITAGELAEDQIRRLHQAAHRDGNIGLAILCSNAHWDAVSRDKLVTIINRRSEKAMSTSSTDERNRIALTGTRAQRQLRVLEWSKEAFGEAQATSLAQRGIRLLEEAIEAYQACGGDRAKALELVEFVFNRDVGELGQEIGGVQICVLALAAAAGFDADGEELRELKRILSTPIEHYTKRNAAKNAAGFLLVTDGAPPAPPAEAAGGEVELRYNGSGTPCDAFEGPCSCGAWHKQGAKVPIPPMTPEQRTLFIECNRDLARTQSRINRGDEDYRLPEIVAMYEAYFMASRTALGHAGVPIAGWETYQFALHRNAALAYVQPARDFKNWILSLASDEQREQALAIVYDGVCRHCGRVVDGCQCMNDE